MGYLTLQYIASSALGFVFLFATIRLVSNFEYGIYSAVLVTVTIAAAIAGMGVNLAATRFVSLYSSGDREKDDETWDAARKSLLLSLLFTGISTTIYCSLSPLFSLYFAKTTAWTWAFLLGGAWIFTSAISNTLQGILQGLKKYSQLAKILFVTRFAAVALTVAALYFYRSVELPILGWVAYYGAIALWIYVLIRSKLTIARGKLNYSKILRYAIPLGIAAIITAFSQYSDSVVVGGFLNPSFLGVYQAAVQVSAVLGVVAVTPLVTALFPEISSSKSAVDISNGVRLAFRFLMLAVVPVSVFVAGVSPQLLYLFTSGGIYLAGTLTLELISLFYVFVAVQTILLYLLQGVGRTSEVIAIGAVAATTDIGVALILVPHFGLAGAVTSKVAVALDGAAISLYFCREYLGTLDKWGFYAKAAVASFIPFIAVFALSSVVSSRLITLVPYAVIFSILYLGCLRGLRVVTSEDKAYLTHVLPSRLRKLADFL